MHILGSHLILNQARKEFIYLFTQQVFAVSPHYVKISFPLCRRKLSLRENKSLLLTKFYNDEFKVSSKPGSDQTFEGQGLFFIFGAMG